MLDLAESGLTGAPQVIEWVAVFVGLSLAAFIGRLNIMRGKNGPPAPPAVGEIAGAIIDKESAGLIVNAIKRETDETAKNTAAMRANTKATEELLTRLEKNTDAAEAAGAMINEARQDIRELTRELVRGR